MYTPIFTLMYNTISKLRIYEYNSCPPFFYSTQVFLMEQTFSMIFYSTQNFPLWTLRMNFLILSKFPLDKFLHHKSEGKLTFFLMIFWYNNFSHVRIISTEEQILCIHSLFSFVEIELHFQTRLFKTSSLLVQTPATVCSQLIDNFVESFFNLKTFQF